MNGIIIISLENGMLLFSQELEPSFGLSSINFDPYQQCGFLYALYSSASAQFDDQSSGEKQKQRDTNRRVCTSALEWFSQEHVMWYFYEEWNAPAPPIPLSDPSTISSTSVKATRILTAVATTADLSHDCK